MTHHFHEEGIAGKAAFILVLAGALNWGLIGLFDYNIISSLLGTGIITKVIYHLIGFSALFVIFKKFLRKEHGADHSH